MFDQSMLILLKTFVFSSVLFVWVIRYHNIVEEFKLFAYPNWLRDLVGILKITFAISILSADPNLVKVGSMGIALLMSAALLTHLKVKNPKFKMLPAFSLLILNLLIYFQSNA